MRKVVLMGIAVIAALALLAALCEAEPTSLVKVIDQEGRPIPDAVVEVMGGSARRINDTHFLVEGSAAGTFALRVSLYNITVFQGVLQLGKNYVVKAAVVDMVVEAPAPDVTVEVYLAGSDKSWRLYGKEKYVLRQVPVATYKFVVHGVVTTEKTIYFTGGMVKVAGSEKLSLNLALILSAITVPTAGYLGYRYYSEKREGLKIEVKLPLGRPPLEKPPTMTHTPRPLSKKEKPEKLKKPRKKAKREKTEEKAAKEKPKPEKTKKARKRRSMTLADLLEIAPE